MGVRLLSSIFGKNPSPSPTGGEASPPPVAPTKSPVAKTRLGSTSREPNELERSRGELNTEPSNEESSSVSKRTVPSKLGIGVGGNVLAEMKARQERRISGILKQNSEESDFSERSEKIESSMSKSSSLSPNPLGGIRLRPTPPTPEEPEPPKLPEKTGIRFGRPPAAAPPAEKDEAESKSNPLAGIKLRPRGGSEEPEPSPAKSEDKPNVLNHFRLRTTSTTADESASSPDPSTSEVKANPLSGVRLRSTGINVIDPLKSPNNDGGSGTADNKNEARNSLTKLKPPPLAPKPRPWSIVGSDKKPGKEIFLLL